MNEYEHDGKNYVACIINIFVYKKKRVQSFWGMEYKNRW